MSFLNVFTGVVMIDPENKLLNILIIYPKSGCCVTVFYAQTHDKESLQHLGANKTKGQPCFH